MKATLAVVLALAFILSFVAIGEDTNANVSDANDVVIIDESKTYHDGEIFELNNDYKLSPNVVLTFEAGAVLKFDLLTSWSIEGGAESKFVFNEGAKVLFTALTYLSEYNTIDEDTSVAINGKIIYSASVSGNLSAMKPTATLTITDGTVGVINGTSYKFKETSATVSAELDMSISDIMTKDLSDVPGSFSADVTVKSKGVELTYGDLYLGSISSIDADMSADITMPASDANGKFTIALKGDADISANIMGLNINASEKIDITGGLDGITDDIDWFDPSTLKDVIPFISGDMSGKVEISGDLGTFNIKNAKASYSASFGKETAEVKIDSGVEKITVEMGGVTGEINDIQYYEEIDVELGTFMELLSGRNVVGDLMFILAYNEEAGAASMHDFLKAYLMPAVSDESTVESIITQIMGNIPEDMMYETGMPFAYVLFFMQIDGKDFGKVCQEAYDNTHEKGMVSQLVVYTENLAAQIAVTVTGVEDFEAPDVKGKAKFAMGEFTAAAMDAYSMTFDGFSISAEIDDAISLDYMIGALEMKADTDEAVYEIAIPEMNADVKIGDGISAEYTVSGDCLISMKSKSNDPYALSFTIAINDIDATELLDVGDKVVKYTTDRSVKSIEITINDLTVTTDKISESQKMTIDAGDIFEIFSLRNLDYMAEFIYKYDPTLNEQAYRLVLSNYLYSAYPSEETEEIIEQIIANTPEAAVTTLGINCQYALFVFGKEGVDMQIACKDIAASIKDIESPEGFFEYTTKVAEKIFEVVTGIEDFQDPSFSTEFEMDIGKIIMTYKDEEMTFNGASLDVVLNEDVFSVKGDFKGYSMEYADDELAVEFVLPEAKFEIAYDDEISVDYSVKGDFVFMYYDPQDKFNSYTWSLEGLDISDSATIGEDGIIKTSSHIKIGDVYGYYGNKNNRDFAFFMMDGADIKVTGTADLASVLEAIFSGDYSQIEADIEMKGSITGLMYSQHLPSAEKQKTYKAAIDNMSFDIKASNGENGPAFSGSYSIEDGYRSTAKRSYTIEDMKVNFSYENGKGTADLTGSMYAVLFENGEAVEIYSADDITAKGELIPSEASVIGIKPTELTAEFSIWDYGITTDYGTIELVDDGTGYHYKSDKVTVSGNYTGHGLLKSAEGTINGVALIPGNDSKYTFKYTDANIVFTDKLGHKAEISFTPNDASKILTTDVKTSGSEGVIHDSFAAVEGLHFMEIVYSEYYDEYRDSVIISGDVPFLTDGIDATISDYKGVIWIHAGEVVLGDGRTMNVSFVGAMLGVDYNAIGGPAFVIAPLPGYDLDPSTYEGFTVDANNKVSPIFEEGVANLATHSQGKAYTLTINGLKNNVRYGDEFTMSYTGGDEPLWLVDSDGHIHGEVVNSVFTYTYHHLGDLTLTPVYGTKAQTGAEASVVKVDDDAFFVQPADHPFVVENKSGVAFLIDGAAGEPYYKFSAVETKYDGHKAYEIHGNNSARVLVPINTYDGFVFHVVNGTDVPMATDIFYDADNDQYYVTFMANSYSIYYVIEEDHEGGGSSSSVMLYVVIVIVALVVIAGAAIMASKKKEAA